MTTPLLATKLYLPAPRPHLVDRPRLLVLLNARLDRNLTLVSAPAGFGKTTLVSGWVAQCKQPVGWLALDADDGDLTRFFRYFVAALQRVMPTIGASLAALLNSSQPISTELLLTLLLNELAAIPEQVFLVLDDYHLLENHAIDEALTFLLDHQPPQLQLIITTREDPQLPLARYRVRNQLTEIRAADLRFTSAEAAKFLNQLMGLSLSPAEIAALDKRTEGWIAGLQMAALSMQGRDDTSAFVEAFTGSHRFVLDYLAEEVLRQQPAQVRQFLLHTAILERMSGPLCAAVTAQADAEALLAHLERANLFVVPLDEERRWYRYHHLFADVLRQSLHREAPDAVAKLHQRASRWYEIHALPIDAIRHAYYAGDMDQVAALIECAWPATRRNRGETILLDWMRTLPDAIIKTRPVLSVIYAWLLLDSSELDGVELHLLDAEQWLLSGEYPDQRGAIVVDQAQFRSLPAAIANARAYHAQARGDAAATIAFARQALELLPEDNYYERGTAGAFLGLAYWTNGDLEAAYRAFADGLATLDQGGGILSAIGGTSILAHIRIAQGRLRDAAALLERALSRAATLREPLPLATADLHRALSEIYCEWNDLATAHQQLQRSMELGKQSTTISDRYHRLIAQARLLTAQGDLEAVPNLLQQAAQLYHMIPIPNLYPIEALIARMWLRQGRLNDALNWVQAEGLSIHGEPQYLQEYKQITFVRVLIAQYGRDQHAQLLTDASAFLAWLLAAADAGQRGQSVLEILLLQAIAHTLQNKLDAALASLQRALILAQPQGYLRIFVDEGALMAQLLREALVRGMMPDYVKRVLAAFPTTTHQSEQRPTLSTGAPQQSLVEPLSERELDVLRLLNTELSGPEIARELVVALSTVRTHTKRIYGKLNVNSRRAAIKRAKELELI